MSDPLDSLADELYDLRSALERGACGEVSYTVERLAAMRARVRELEPVAGERLHELLARGLTSSNLRRPPQVWES